ncbi:MAG: class I SAM-dependent methyltransferase [Pseudomonadales bacterium]
MSAKNGPIDNHGIDWTRYSSSYDLMVRYNPYYRENIELAIEVVAEIELSPTARIGDLGAGTGNYIAALSSIIPEGRFTHVDADPGMNAIASDKYSRVGLDVGVITSEVASLAPSSSEYDLLLCINALYAMPKPREVLEWVFKALSPGGHFFVIDYGRKMKVGGWALELTKAAYAEKGWKGVFQLYRQAPELIRQNSTGSKMQDEGGYWTHSTNEFLAALKQAGFSVLHSGTCYRDACDFALVRKPN